MVGGLRQERDTVARVHPSTRGKLSEQSVQMSGRAMMFLKLGARALPPAVLQAALGFDADTLLGDDIDDDEFTKRAQAVIEEAQVCLEAIRRSAQ